MITEIIKETLDDEQSNDKILDFTHNNHNDEDHCSHHSCNHDHNMTYRRSQPKIGRNDPCLCGSGKKFKKCCVS